MSAFQLTGSIPLVLQCIFQAVYTSTYASFLVIYARMRVMPPLDYVAGVALYTLGYACFLALYAVVASPAGEDDAALVSMVLYVAGSVLFLAGSALLVRATIPPPVPMLFRKISFIEELKGRFSLCDQQSSLFWGSMSFLFGSVLFTIDASWSASHPKSKPELLAPFCINMGYAFFTVGRLYFLWGSTTADCDIFFRSSAGSSCKCCSSFFSGIFAFCRRSSTVTPCIEDGSGPREAADVDSMFNISNERAVAPMDTWIQTDSKDALENQPSCQ